MRLTMLAALALTLASCGQTPANPATGRMAPGTRAASILDNPILAIDDKGVWLGLVNPGTPVRVVSDEDYAHRAEPPSRRVRVVILEGKLADTLCTVTRSDIRPVNP